MLGFGKVCWQETMTETQAEEITVQDARTVRMLGIL